LTRVFDFSVGAGRIPRTKHFFHSVHNVEHIYTRTHRRVSGFELQESNANHRTAVESSLCGEHLADHLHKWTDPK
jgi:hypothetical protein